MNSSLTPAELEAAKAPAFVNRYLSAIALASLLYDHIRTLETEVSDVWISLKVSRAIKLGFILGRYAADIALLYSAYALSGAANNLDQVGCKVWLGIFWVAEAFCTAVTEGIVLYRLKEIWGRRNYLLNIIPVFLLCISATMIGLQIPQFYVTLGYIEEWRTCATEPLTPVFTIVQYSALAITDIAVIILFIAAVLEIPYKDSAEVIVKLEKDGGWYFVSLFVIHLGCILVLATGKAYFPVLLPLAWSLTMIINSRIFHRIGLDKKRADEVVNLVFTNPGHQLVRID